MEYDESISLHLRVFSRIEFIEGPCSDSSKSMKRPTSFEQRAEYLKKTTTSRSNKIMAVRVYNLLRFAPSVHVATVSHGGEVLHVKFSHIIGRFLARSSRDRKVSIVLYIKCNACAYFIFRVCVLIKYYLQSWFDYFLCSCHYQVSLIQLGESTRNIVSINAAYCTCASHSVQTVNYWLSYQVKIATDYNIIFSLRDIIKLDLLNINRY